MMYASVTVAALVSFGILFLETAHSRSAEAWTVRFLGLRGTPGFHLAAWGVAVILLAAPIDDLWHRLFGLDVTLWSPPHLFGLLGAAISTVGCLVIASEVYRSENSSRLVAILVAGALLYNGLRVMIDPAYLIAYSSGGVLFYAPAMLAVLVLPLVLVATSLLTERRDRSREDSHKRQPRRRSHQHVARGAVQPDHAHGAQALHAAHKRLQQEARESSGSGCALHRALQFLPHP